MSDGNNKISITCVSWDVPYGHIDLRFSDRTRAIAGAMAQLSGVHWGDIVTYLVTDALERTAQRMGETMRATLEQAKRPND